MITIEIKLYTSEYGQDIFDTLHSPGDQENMPFFGRSCYLETLYKPKNFPPPAGQKLLNAALKTVHYLLTQFEKP